MHIAPAVSSNSRAPNVPSPDGRPFGVASDRRLSSVRLREGRTRMTGKRTRYSVDFKAKVALEALRGELTTAQLAAKHGIHKTMVGEWKRQAMEGLTAVFAGKAAAQESAKATEAELGQLVVERDFLARASGR